MQISSPQMTVAEYCENLHAQKIIVNHDYQRSNKVWPAAAQSFLIESILLGFPVPKMALYQITDRETRTTVRELVDGQQRTEAILQFFDNNLRLSRTLEFEDASGRTYNQLSEDLQDKFLSYILGFDMFVDASAKDIRETFRRVNAYETPLNGEEQRYARYQGEFKWFIYRMSKAYDDTFKTLGTFGEKQLARMADMKLLSEIVHAIINGITTTNRQHLNALYAAYDDSFSEDENYTTWMDEAILTLVDLDELHKTAITKPLALYSLILALIHSVRDVESLRGVFPGGKGLRDRSEMARRLADLAEVLETDESLVPKKYLPFYKASDKGTNVALARQTRVRFFGDAISL